MIPKNLSPCFVGKNWSTHTAAIFFGGSLINFMQSKIRTAPDFTLNGCSVGELKILPQISLMSTSRLLHSFYIVTLVHVQLPPCHTSTLIATSSRSPKPPDSCTIRFFSGDSKGSGSNKTENLILQPFSFQKLMRSSSIL